MGTKHQCSLSSNRRMAMWTEPCVHFILTMKCLSAPSDQLLSRCQCLEIAKEEDLGWKKKQNVGGECCVWLRVSATRRVSSWPWWRGSRSTSCSSWQSVWRWLKSLSSDADLCCWVCDLSCAKNLLSTSPSPLPSSSLLSFHLPSSPLNFYTPINWHFSPSVLSFPLFSFPLPFFLLLPPHLFSSYPFLSVSRQSPNIFYYFPHLSPPYFISPFILLSHLFCLLSFTSSPLSYSFCFLLLPACPLIWSPLDTELVLFSLLVSLSPLPCLSLICLLSSPLLSFSPPWVSQDKHSPASNHRFLFPPFVTALSPYSANL